MRTLLHLSTAVLLILAPLSAQASFKSYGTACNAAVPLSVTGIPQLGASFTVNGVKLGPFFACTRRFCPGPCSRCNTCTGTHGFLTIGVSKISAPLTPTCNLLNSAEFVIAGSATGMLTYNVPNNPSLIGQKFYMQRADVTVAEWMGSNCPTHIRPDSIVGMSDGVEGTLGL